MADSNSFNRKPNGLRELQQFQTVSAKHRTRTPMALRLNDLPCCVLKNLALYY